MMTTNSSTSTSFNTASGKHCYFITFVFPSLRSGTRDVRASSSLRSSAASHPSSHTASGRYCCFITFVFPSLRSGTRDVRTSSSLCSSAASYPSSHTASGKYCCNKSSKSLRPQKLRIVSIPQAVSTVATMLYNAVIPQLVSRFNTASGKYCCNMGAFL